MGDYQPLRPEGPDEEFKFHGGVWDRTYGPRGRIRSSASTSISRTVKGIFFKSRGSGSATNSGQKLYKTTNLVSENYIFAEPWDPSVDNGDGTFGAPSGAPVAVAKCLAGRMPLSELIDGILYTYVYGDANGDNGDNIRLASATGQSDEWHVMHKRYTDMPFRFDLGITEVPGLILAAKVSGGTGVTDLTGAQITMTEMSSRAGWTYQDSQSGLLTS